MTTSYQTNFSGIKYNNNPLAVDINSFSNANNVYLNKYGALISRPPIEGIDYPWQVYGTNPIPTHLKLLSIYNLSNGGIIYVVLNTTTGLYNLRYKSPLGSYSLIVVPITIDAYNKFLIVQYKQYYIVFNTDEAKALDTSLPSNTWVALSTIVDIPVTLIQTGNEQLTIPGNLLTASYKTQFILKPDSDDTIYNLPTQNAVTSQISVPSQSDVTYGLYNAHQYTRRRILRKLGTPSNNNSSALVSMVGEKLAIAHSDRVDISLDGGNSFTTIVYPTISSTRYKNTASLSDDGQCFFYVHSDGVYRYMLGTGDWSLIEVTLNYTYDDATNILAGYSTRKIEREIKGRAIDPVTTVGANYCHFINAEKFVFALADNYTNLGTWAQVIYTKGLNTTNFFDKELKTNTGLLTSFAELNISDVNEVDTYVNIHTIPDIDRWKANPYLNKKLIKAFDNNNFTIYSKTSANNVVGVLFKATDTFLWRFHVTQNVYHSTPIKYVTFATHTVTTTSASETNELIQVSPDVLTPDDGIVTSILKILTKRAVSEATWREYKVRFISEVEADASKDNHIINFVITLDSTANMNISGTSLIIHEIAPNQYLSDTTLQIVNNNVVANMYDLPLSLTVNSQVVVSSPNYLIYDTLSNRWYTNIPILTTITYTNTSNTVFKQVPIASFNDQNLWLAMNNTLWIGGLIGNKLSVQAINNNTFPKPITAICAISATSKAIFFEDNIVLCEQATLDNSIAWYYYPLKFTLGVRAEDTVITTNDGKLTIFPTKYGLAALTYQLDIAATEQAITYLSDDIKNLWLEFYNTSTNITILHHNTQLILTNQTNMILIYDFRTNGWYPLSFPSFIKIGRIQPDATNHELLELQPANSALTATPAIYHLNKEKDELYSYATPYKDLGSIIIPWHLTSQILLLNAPNNYKNITQVIVDQVDSNTLKQSAYLTAQLFRQKENLVKSSFELLYNIDTFGKIIKKVNWWKVLGIKWQLENDTGSSYPTQLRLYNVSINYDVSYEVK